MNEPSLLNQVRESLPELRHIIQYTGTPTTEGVSPLKYHQNQKEIVSDYLLGGVKNTNFQNDRPI